MKVKTFDSRTQTSEGGGGGPGSSDLIRDGLFDGGKSARAGGKQTIRKRPDTPHSIESQRQAENEGNPR